MKSHLFLVASLLLSLLSYSSYTFASHNHLLDTHASNGARLLTSSDPHSPTTANYINQGMQKAQEKQVNYAALGLIFLGMVFMISELFLTSYGLLWISGLIIFTLGSILLVNTGLLGYNISLSLILCIAIINLLIFLFILGIALKARSKKPITGAQAMIGRTGEALDSFEGIGLIKLEGEIWQGMSTLPVQRGEKVIVEKIRDLTLYVSPLKK